MPLYFIGYVACDFCPANIEATKFDMGRQLKTGKMEDAAHEKGWKVIRGKGRIATVYCPECFKKQKIGEYTDGAGKDPSCAEKAKK